jgi:chitinase
LTIPAGQQSGITIKINGDTLAESSESFPINIFNATNATIGDGSGTATITDNDAAPVASTEDFTTTEGDVNLNVDVKVTLASPSQQTLTFDYRTIDGLATGADYDLLGGAVTFTPGQLERTIPLVIKGDVLDEPAESFVIQIVKPADGSVMDSTTVTINDNDQKSLLSIGDASADEPSSGTTTMTFTVKLEPASARTVTVGYGTMDGTAGTGSDYTSTSGTLTFQPFQTSQDVTVPIIGDTINEENETVLVNLVAAGGALIGDAQGQGTIIDKNAPPSLSISDTVASEGGGARFTVELAGTTLRTVTVGFVTSDGSAREPGDYASRRGTLTFAPGEKTKTLEVTVVDDALAETVETFSVGLGDAVNATITKSRGVATIEASDQATTSSTPPSGNPVRPTTPPASQTLLPKMVLAPRTVNVTRTGLARLFLTCAKTSPIACRGSITLQTTGKPAVKLGSKTFLVAKGKKKTLGVKLSPKARKLLAKRPTLRARVVVLVKTGKKSLRVVPGVITLKAAPKSAKPKSAKKSTAPKDPPTDVTVGN